jgi:hypothetical protein
MRILFAILSSLALSACSNPPASPTGLYRLSVEEKSMTLELRTGGDYVLQIDAPGRNTDEIRGRWEERGSGGPYLLLHGLVWRGTEPEAGQGVWSTSLGRHADICLEAEVPTCFLKDDKA